MRVRAFLSILFESIAHFWEIQLLEENFNSMGSSPAACELWIAAMEVAVSAAEHARRKTDPTSRRRHFTCGPDYAPKIVEIVPIRDTEGSIRYKRRRRRKD